MVLGRFVLLDQRIQYHAPGLVGRFARIDARVCGIGDLIVFEQRELKREDACGLVIGRAIDQLRQLLLCERNGGRNRLPFAFRRTNAARLTLDAAQSEHRSASEPWCRRCARETDHLHHDAGSKSRSTRSMSACTAATASSPWARKCSIAPFGVLLPMTFT